MVYPSTLARVLRTPWSSSTPSLLSSSRPAPTDSRDPRTRNQAPKAGWYIEGVAEHLGWHTWDGEELVLGVIPPVSLKDYPRLALEEVTAEGFDFTDAVHGEAPLKRPGGGN